MRAIAKIESEIDSFLSLNNALFDKTCENPRKHIDAKILADEYETIKTVYKPTFKDIFRY